MKANYAPLAIKNAGVELETVVPEILKQQPPVLDHFVQTSRLYRRVATGILLASGDPQDFYAYLFNSGRAFLYFLENVTEDQKVTSKAEAFFDAVACRDDIGALALAQKSRHTLNRGKEYEEDFLHVSFLMKRFFLDVHSSELQAMLNEWHSYADENPDPRLAVCRALLERDQDGFDEAVAVAIEDKVDRWSQQYDADELDPDAASTTCHVNTQVLSWIEFAERAGLATQSDYRLAPGSARQFHRSSFPSPDAWRSPAGFSSF